MSAVLETELETESSYGVNFVGKNCAYYLLLSDLNMKTTTKSRQTSPHISYILIHTLSYKQIYLHSSNECNSQNKRTDLDGTCTFSAAPRFR